MEPWLSVLMPTFQAAGHLEAALGSVAAEAAEGLEVVLADDGSTDDTLAIAARFAGRLPLRVLHRGGDGSWPAGASKALAAARGRWACLLFHDDLWLPGRVAAVRAALARAPEARLLVGPAEFVGAGGERLGPWGTPFGARDAVLPGAEVAARLLVQNWLAAPAPVFDRAAALAAGGLDPALWYTADWDLWLALAPLGPVAHLGRPTVGFRLHPGAMTLSRRRSAAEFRAQLEAVLERHAPRLGAAAAPRAREARLSVEVNVALAERARGGRPPLGPVLGAALRAGPAGVARYLRGSRLAERVRARLRSRTPAP